ncbi:hypothetical protein T11_639 [Trichinella zimbabwensis]|uniref:Uncharacterized protein n=1 Tax=Trichinella zimbabwensis TaxID=268475 RepID=A0A0V1I6K4_9BILA|nr:hypothetical protein T11_639 [Trichinella zimbabwensis]
MRDSETLLMNANRSIHCRDGTFLLSQFPLYRIHEFVAALLATQKNTLLVHLPLLWSIPYSDASIAPKPTPSIYKLYLFTISGTDTSINRFAFLSHLFFFVIGSTPKKVVLIVMRMRKTVHC